MSAATDRDLRWLHHVIAESRASRAAGHHPFAAAVVDADDIVLARAWNAHALDRTSHAEMMALRSASADFPVERLRAATLYTSAEPCAMCAGAAYWTGIGRVVYALAETSLAALTGAHPDNPTLALPCRAVFAAGQRQVVVVGPLLEDEAREAHRDFWQ
jgi:tRNA(Arg) A34 adenosine deaminase TadA